MELQSAERPVANPLIILREEFDDWAILFDPDSGDGYGLNPVGVFIWKLLDGTHSLDDILSKLRDHCENVPGNAERDITEFIRQLIDRGLAGFEIT
jgi:SynChlorMet cassette protein ScmD